MEYEGDEVKTLESRLAQIEEWKRCKDDAEYRAKVKAENEYWEAVENLKKYHKRIENVCALADKLYSYHVYTPSFGKCSLITLLPTCSQNYKNYFGIAVYDNFSANIDHYILYDEGEFHYCTKTSRSSFNPIDRHKPETEYLRMMNELFPEFEKKFYEWFDKKLKI